MVATPRRALCQVNSSQYVRLRLRTKVPGGQPGRPLSGGSCVPSVGNAFVSASGGQCRGGVASGHQAVQREDGLPGGHDGLVERVAWVVAVVEGGVSGCSCSPMVSTL